MIIVKLISGLGNQLFQYAIGRKLALMHNVDLKVDTSFFANQNLRSYKLSPYNINTSEATSNEVNSLLNLYQSSGLIAKAYRRIEQYIPKRHRHYFREDEWWVYEPELLRSNPSIYIDGYWQHYRYFENVPSQIFDELTLKEPYPFEAQIFLDKIINNESAVALHIRRGDYVTDPNAQSLMGVLPLDYYRQAIVYVKSRVEKPIFYVFSDDLQWASENLKLDADIVLIDIAQGKLDYIELDLMSKCKHAIIANSSFSWWGAFLNRNPEKIIVAPAQWVVPVEINKRIKIQLPSWKII